MLARLTRLRRIRRYDPADYGILSATWILASNDENPIMTYASIKYRIGLDDSYDLRRLVESHGELFRRGVQKTRLDEWKVQLRDDKHMPSWLRDLPESKRPEVIERLSAEDVFRSQFRARSKAPRSPIEIVDWGLQHIDRLRKADMEAREATIKSWQAWLVIILSVINIAVTLIVAFWGNS